MPALSPADNHTHRPHNPVGEAAAAHPGFVKIGRAGWFAKGAVYLIAGYLILSVALRAKGLTDRSANQEASPTGAIKTVANSGGGTFLLWLLAVGMVLYAIWRLVTAMLPGKSGVGTWVHRIGYVVSAVVYTTFAISAAALARHATSRPDGNKNVTDISASIMTHTSGRLVIGAVGIIVIAAGLYRTFKGITVDVKDELDVGGMSSTVVTWAARIGAIGEIGRGVGIALVGYFMLRSAVTYDVGQATGLDGALRRLTADTWGIVVVAIVGVGFIAYGAFCVVTFPYRRLQAP
jgi:hypothetical protein